MRKDYNDFNTSPEGLKIISKDEWSSGMFEYCTGPKELRQVRHDEERGFFDLIMFDVPNFDNKKLGYAVMHIWWDNKRNRNLKKTMTKFCRYGTDEDWQIFKHKFAAQFANDNS